MKKNFDVYNEKECIRFNLFSTLFFIVTLIVSVVIDIVIFKVSQTYLKNSNNTFADLIAIVVMIFITMFILILYNLIISFKIKVYKEFYNIIKSFAGITICNLVVTTFLYFTTKTVLPWIYIISIILINTTIFSIRYSFIKFNVSKVDSSNNTYP